MSAAHEMVADERWRSIDFISDLHLCTSQPATFDAFAAHMRHTPADAVFILGDLFELWYGDDAGELPFESQCLQVLREAAAKRHVALMVGNRDFLFSDALVQRQGMHPLPDPTLLCAWQQRVLLTHGDALCLSDVDYQRFRAWTRNVAAQQAYLAKPLAERAQLAASIRHASEAGRHQSSPSPAALADVDADAAVEWLRDAGAVRMVHGHTHRPGDSTLRPGFERIVLSDWDLDHEPPRAEVLRLTRDGFRRIAPATEGG
jgi:UDP-2,3-diacylglucosamine hydrolase